ncbi:hypothetical protein [Parvularcula sp. IMCC14364]|uniref:hypothetical protein n=1 Tax=Parvularcula sp. IMCC14364 TaxID=3067902 RepID=UPI00274208F1|nr:hypothetical protein [Parvularcula sp. IMCC14364]
MRHIPVVMGVVFIFSMSSCARSEASADVYTLYRDSPYLEEIEKGRLDIKWQRVHVATFDARNMDTEYNSSKCLKVKEFFQNEWREYHQEKPEHWSHFWCEPGGYK